jgi:hypothetical protein
LKYRLTLLVAHTEDPLLFFYLPDTSFHSRNILGADLTRLENFGDVVSEIDFRPSRDVVVDVAWNPHVQTIQKIATSLDVTMEGKIWIIKH